MKINNAKDICVFLDKLRHWCEHDCSACILNQSDIELKGELEAVKECEHEWEYSPTYNLSLKYVDRFSKYCKFVGCDAREEIMIGNISNTQIEKLFEDN